MKIKLKGEKRKVELTHTSAFTGRLRNRETGEVKKCDACGEEDAMWAHETTKGHRLYLCFGCGDH